MKSPILGQAYTVRTVNEAANRMVNLFLENAPGDALEPGYLSSAPGLRRLATVGSGPIRGLYSFKGVGYVVSGDQLFKIDSSYNATLLGTVTGSGPVSMADNGIQLFVACNPDGFIYNINTSVFQQITTDTFPGAVTVGFLDGYFVFNEPNSQRVWLTALYDGTSIDSLDFTSADGAPDLLVGLMVDHREVWMFGTTSVEVWYDAGNYPDFPFARVQGVFIETGCAAPYSLAKMDNSIFWVGSDPRGKGIIYRTNGYNIQRISSHAIEYAISQYGDLSGAIGYTYQQQGHSFYVLTFPGTNYTWCYEIGRAHV